MAMGVSDDLYFDVVWVENKFFEVTVAVAKAGDGFLAGLIVEVDEGFFCFTRAHAAATTTGGRLDHHGETDFFGEFESVFSGFVPSVTSVLSSTPSASVSFFSGSVPSAFS